MKLSSYFEAVKQNLAALGVNEDSFELYYRKAAEVSAQSYQCEIDQFAQSVAGGISLRVLHCGKTGYASTQILSEESAKWLAETAVLSAQLTENTEVDPIYLAEDNVSCSEVDIDTDFDSDLMMQRLIEGEKICAEADSRVTAVSDSAAAAESGMRAILNGSRQLYDKTDLAMCYYSPICKEGDDVYNEYHMEFAHDLGSLDFDGCAKKSVSATTDYIGSAPVASGSYAVALSPKVARSLLSCFGSIFSGLSASKGLSLLKDKVGQKIAADIVTIVDAPAHEKSLMRREFDDQGVSTCKKNVVENGVLTTLLHNLKTAAEFGVNTTANAYKGSYTAPLSVAPQNFYFENGSHTLAELLASSETVLQICDTKGLHAGANPATGDFSLECKGFLYQNGLKVQPVSGITVAGNFYTVLKDIVCIADDLEFGSPGSSCVGSPTILVQKLAVAGK